MQLMKKKKLKWVYSYADRVGARHVVFIAPDQWAEEKIRVKDLRETDEATKEVDVTIDELCERFTAAM